METARTRIILRELFSSLLPNKMDKFHSTETINSTEKEVLDGLEEYIQFTKIESAQQFNYIFQEAAIESLIEVVVTMKYFFDIAFKDEIDYSGIIVYVVFCCQLIEHLDDSELENTTEVIYKYCIKLILAHVESWIQSDGEKWNEFRSSDRLGLI